jgi:hypothetical protein
MMMMRKGQRTPACIVTPSSNRRSAIAFKPSLDGPSQCDVRLQFPCVAFVTEYPTPDWIILFTKHSGR